MQNKEYAMSSTSSKLSLPPWLQQYKEESNRQVKEHKFFARDEEEEGGEESGLLRNRYPLPDLLSNPNSSPNSASSSEAEEDDHDYYLDRFKVKNDENLKVLCDALERKVSWQRDIIPEIAETILHCRSGLKHKEETWLLFLGADHQGKERIAREIAKVVFGSQSKFVSIGVSNFSYNTIDGSRNKRARDEPGRFDYVERLGLALNENPHRVFFMEDVEQLDSVSQKGIKQSIENGSLSLPGGENVPLKDSVIIFCCDSLSSLSRVCCSSSKRPKIEYQERGYDDDNGGGESNGKSSCVSMDLNIAIEDLDHKEHLIGDISILESVDGQFVFKIQEL